MITLNEAFLGKYDLLVKYLVTDQINYLEENVGKILESCWCWLVTILL